MISAHSGGQGAATKTCQKQVYSYELRAWLMEDAFSMLQYVICPSSSPVISYTLYVALVCV